VIGYLFPWVDIKPERPHANNMVAIRGFLWRRKMSVYTMANLRNAKCLRGKYNGRLIVGFGVKIAFDFSFWAVVSSWNFGEPYLILGPMQIRAFAVYR
jgi:hypothetical protein